MGRAFAGVLIGAGLASCCMADPVGVIVTDPAGRPVEGATVRGVSPSFDGSSSTTDRDGEARIPWALNSTAWIVVSKDGFERTPQIPVDQPRPIRVILRTK